MTSHRASTAHGATAHWLTRIGLPFHELYCSNDKIARCQEIGIDVLIDDSPVNLIRARDAGIAGATIRHPWNATLCERDEVVWGWDWPELHARLTPLLGRWDGRAGPGSPTRPRGGEARSAGAV